LPDIDECRSNNGGCEYECVNREGGYHCECPIGQQIQQDARTCLGKE